MCCATAEHQHERASSSAKKQLHTTSTKSNRLPTETRTPLIQHCSSVKANESGLTKKAAACLTKAA
jgi:hypothetical protein